MIYGFHYIFCKNVNTRKCHRTEIFLVAKTTTKNHSLITLDCNMKANVCQTTYVELSKRKIISLHCVFVVRLSLSDRS